MNTTCVKNKYGKPNINEPRYNFYNYIYFSIRNLYMVYYYASNNTMTVTNKEAKQFDEQLEKLRKEKELELLMKKFKEKGGNVEKLKPQRITAQMKRDNTI